MKTPYNSPEKPPKIASLSEVKSSKEAQEAKSAAEPDPTLIEQLEELLDEAKNGNLQSIYIVCGWDGNFASSGFISSSPYGCLIKMLGEYEYNKKQIIDWLDRTMEFDE